jgi:uncharacterized protein (TIRG00374 family)
VKKLKHLLWLPVPVLLYWALKDIQFRQLSEHLGNLTLLEIAALLAVNLVFVLILTLRWAVILRDLGAPVKIVQLFSYRLAGYAVSYLTPGPQFGGEPLQLYLAKKDSNLGLAVGSASILLDKTFELLGNFAFLGIALLATLPLGWLADSSWRPALLLTSLLIVLPAAYLAAVFFGNRPLSWCLGHLPAALRGRSWFVRVDTLVQSGETKIVAACRRRGRVLLQILLFFILVWTVSLAEMHLALHFFGIPARLDQTLLILGGAKFAFLLPFPGGLGALELTYVGIFELLDYEAEAGMSLVLYMRARDLLFALAGLLVAFRSWWSGRPVNSPERD